MQPTDEQWIRRFQGGDETAFEDMVARWSPVVLRLAQRLTGDAEEARDVRQTAFLRTLHALDGFPHAGFNGQARFSTWLYRVVVNLCRDGHRRRGVAERLREDVGRRSDDADAATPESISARGEVAERVAGAVRGLPAPEREVVVLRHYHELPFPRIAEVLDTPVTTVKSRMYRGLRLLRARLEDLQP